MKFNAKHLLAVGTMCVLLAAGVEAQQTWVWDGTWKPASATAPASAPSSSPASKPSIRVGAPATASAPATGEAAAVAVAQPGVIVRGRVNIVVAGGQGGAMVVTNGPAKADDDDETATAPATMPATYPAVNADEVKKLAAKLDSDEYKEREAAQKALTNMGAGIVPVLRELLKAPNLSLESKMRMEKAINTVMPATKPAKPNKDVRILPAAGGPVQGGAVITIQEEAN